MKLNHEKKALYITRVSVFPFICHWSVNVLSIYTECSEVCIRWLVYIYMKFHTVLFQIQDDLETISVKSSKVFVVLSLLKYTTAY